jgi:hypothetical protein
VDHERLVKPNEETCLKCHTLRPSHKSVRVHPWNFALRWKRIKHGKEQ